MKIITMLIFTCFLTSSFFSINDTYGDESKTGNIVTNEKKKKETPSIIDQIWIKIRTLSPKRKRRSSASAVAGVKGKEMGSEELKPLWKGEEMSTVDLEIEKISVAEDFIEKGECNKAVVSLKNYQEEFPHSSFIPNVIFMKGFCMVKLDDKDKAKEILNGFVKKYTDHEFTPDAKQILKTL